MEETKSKHLETLRYLQNRPNQREDLGHDHSSNSGWNDHDDDDHQHQPPRASNRLANKDKLNYKQINRRGFQDF